MIGLLNREKITPRMKQAGRRVLLVLLLALLGLLYWIVIETATGRSVQYNRRAYEPAVAELCPGDTLTWQVDLSINQDAIIEVTESWCHPEGNCVSRYNVTSNNVVTAGTEYHGPAYRTVPDLPPGEWELRHGSKNGQLKVYIVPFSIKDGCQ